MTGGATPEERRIVGLPPEHGPPSAEDVDRTERTVEALLRLRDQLLHTQAVLDEYLALVGTHADDAPRTPGA